MNRRRSSACVVPDTAVAHLKASAMLPAATLTEILVALGVLAIALTVFVSVLQLGVHSAAAIHEQTTAARLARSQMEIIKNAAWPGPYPAVTSPPGYIVSVSLSQGPLTSLQLVQVRVQHDQRDVLTLQGYKGQR